MALLHRVHAKSLERACLKLLEQAVGGGVGGEYPVVELKGEVAAGECLLDPLLVAALHKHLLGSEIAQQLVDVFIGPLGSEKLAGADVEKRHAGLPLVKVECCQEVVLPVVEDIVVD